MSVGWDNANITLYCPLIFCFKTLVLTVQTVPDLQYYLIHTAQTVNILTLDMKVQNGE